MDAPFKILALMIASVMTLSCATYRSSKSSRLKGVFIYYQSISRVEKPVNFDTQVNTYFGFLGRKKNKLPVFPEMNKLAKYRRLDTAWSLYANGENSSRIELIVKEEYGCYGENCVAKYVGPDGYVLSVLDDGHIYKLDGGEDKMLVVFEGQMNVFKKFVDSKGKKAACYFANDSSNKLTVKGCYRLMKK